MEDARPASSARAGLHVMAKMAKATFKGFVTWTEAEETAGIAALTFCVDILHQLK